MEAKIIKVKICGLKNILDIQYVNKTLPDYVGFVFAKSKRQITFETAKNFKSKLDTNIKSVGVFVNEDIYKIKFLCDENIIDIIQLHGDENIDYINSLKKLTPKEIIKAIRVNENSFFEKIESFSLEENNSNSKVLNPEQNHSNSKISNFDVEYFLFDSFEQNNYGGTGKIFDWNLVKNFQHKFFLAGGINIDNVLHAIKISTPYCLDISSGVETDGNKDFEKIKKIIDLIRSV